jgi:hypothetical protein
LGQRGVSSYNITVKFTPESNLLDIFFTVLMFENFTCSACCTDASTGITRIKGKGFKKPSCSEDFGNGF